MKKIIWVGFLVILTIFAVRDSPSEPFAHWCNNKARLPPGARHTVDMLLERVGTQDCDGAEAKLTKLTDLNLSDCHITDVAPLASLSTLTTLVLNDNQITNVTSLARLSNLTTLVLSGNQIKDVSPLKSLTNLSWLFLRDNPLTNRTCPVQPQTICNF